MTDSLRLSSNRLPEPDLAAPLPFIEGTYSRCFWLALSRRGLNYRRWALSHRGFRVTTSTTIDMIGELTYSWTEQQLKQLALTRAHNLLEFEVIWGHIDILVVVRRLPRRWKVKTLLAGPSPTSPMRRRLPTSLFPTQERCWSNRLYTVRSWGKSKSKLRGVWKTSPQWHTTHEVFFQRRR